MTLGSGIAVLGVWAVVAVVAVMDLKKSDPDNGSVTFLVGVLAVFATLIVCLTGK